MKIAKPAYPETQIPPELAQALLALARDGKVSCEAARAFAKAQGLETRYVGYILEELGLKVMDCGLGCF